MKYNITKSLKSYMDDRNSILENLSNYMSNLYISGDYFLSLPHDDKFSYEDEYWHEIIDPDGKKRNRLEEKELFLKDIDYIINFVDNTTRGKILDIGCGLGWFLSAIDNNWTKYGVELSKFASEHAKKYGEIYNGAFLTSNFEYDYFDVILLHHVIEHLDDPISNLKKIKNNLKTNGILIIGTPDFDSGCARLFGKNYRLLHDKTHLSLFSNDSMHRFLRDHGFEIIKVEYPFFKTRYFNKENLLKLFYTNSISPPFYGNFMTFFAINKK